MRAVIQRVSAADVVVNGGAPRAIGRGLMILLGVRDTDTLDVCEKLAQKKQRPARRHRKRGKEDSSLPQ